MVVIMLLSLATSVGASVVDEDTFKSLKPEHVSIQWMEGNDSPTTCTLTYSIPTVISEFFTKKDEAEDKERVLGAVRSYGRLGKRSVRLGAG